MKYREFNVGKKLFGENYLIYDWKEKEKEIQIYVKSQKRTEKCPSCGKESRNYHATYERNIQIMPIGGQTSYANVTAYKYDCTNEACKVSVFTEDLPFVLPSQVRSIELNHLILATSLFLSNEGASKVLGLIGVKVSNDTIKRIYDGIEIKDEPEIEAVGIDDVAIRKSHHYATAIYDIKDHHMVALLKGREADTLKEWLKNHKNIKLVTRDRASAYAHAINEVLPDCIQVADRFHLLQNLIEKMREIFRNTLPNEIYIKEGQIQDTPPEKVRVYKLTADSSELNEYEYNNAIPVDGNGNEICYDNKCNNPDRKSIKLQAEGRKKNSI
jgi:transposase